MGNSYILQYSYCKICVTMFTCNAFHCDSLRNLNDRNYIRKVHKSIKSSAKFFVTIEKDEFTIKLKYKLLFSVKTCNLDTSWSQFQTF